METYYYKDNCDNKVIVYGSPYEMAEEAQPEIAKQRAFVQDSFRPESIGYQSCDTINKLAREGDDSMVPQAQKLIEHFAGIPETQRFRNVPSVVGSVPIVPAAIAGHPLSMLRRQRFTSEASPISVALSMSVSSSINADIVSMHGCAVLALVMRLIQDRPVNLILFGENRLTDGGNIYTVCRINTTPLDLASACYAMTNAGFRRGLRLYLSYKHGMIKSGPWASDHGHNEGYYSKVKNRLRLSPDSLVVAGVYGDQQCYSESDWAAWVEEKYRQYSAQQ